MRPKPTIPGERNRIQPKFAFTIGVSHVNMSRLIPFVGEKMETITTDAQNGRHLPAVCGRQPAWQSNFASFDAVSIIHVSIVNSTHPPTRRPNASLLSGSADRNCCHPEMGLLIQFRPPMMAGRG